MKTFLKSILSLLILLSLVSCKDTSDRKPNATGTSYLKLDGNKVIVKKIGCYHYDQKSDTSFSYVEEVIYHFSSEDEALLCHTTLGDTNDPLGRFYLKGNEYKMNTEVTSVSPDTNNQECILCWIDQTKGFGSRFAIKGNIYHDGKPYWPHFTEYFVCPIQRERDSKLNEIGI